MQLTKDTMKKKFMKKKVKNSLLLSSLVLLISSCGGLGITEANFSQSNLTEFNLDNSVELQRMPADAVTKILESAKKNGNNIDYGEYDDWYAYSWESTGNLSAFTVQQSTDCEDMIHYFVFSGSEFLSKKLVALSTSCGDWEAGMSSTKEGNTISISSSDFGYGDVYPSSGSEECKISLEGIIECSPKVNIYPGVSLWNGLALRETPDKKGKYITMVNIGETFTTTDSIDVSEEDEYLHIQLKDGSTGYIINRLVMQKAVPMIILSEAAIYRRPDALTKTPDSFLTMDVVGYSEMGEDYQWFKVKGRPTGEKWFKEGWIKADQSTQNPIDIAVASLVNKALQEKDLAKRVQMLDEIRTNNDFSSSGLLVHLDKILEEQL